jgi:hypothetical protein
MRLKRRVRLLRQPWLLASMLLAAMLAGAGLAWWALQPEAAPPPPLAAPAATGSFRVASPPPLLTAALPTPPVGGTQAWRQAFAQLAPLDLHQAQQRLLQPDAGLREWVVVRAKAARCQQLEAGPVRGEGLMPPTAAMEARFARWAQDCQAPPPPPLPRALADAGDEAWQLLELAHLDPRGPRLPALLALLRREQSPELLLAALPALERAEAWQQLGWVDGRSIGDQLADLYLLRHAIELAACNAQLDCRRAAAERHACTSLQDCVDDLRELVPRHVLGEEAQRPVFLREFPREGMGDFVRLLEGRLRELGRSPAELEPLRAALTGQCASTACLSASWALAQRRAACLAGLRSMVECAPSSLASNSQAP